MLKNHTVLGKLRPVKSVTPPEVVHKELPEQKEADLSEGTEPESTLGDDIDLETFDPDVDLSELGPAQKEIARKSLCEEWYSFAKSEEEIGCVKELELEINLSDERPVQKNYTAVPKPLYGEARHYVEDLLNRGWIKHSKSPYTSPVVCVRKRDGDLRLCINCRELNRQTVTYRFPLPKVQETLEALGGSQYFSLLDQGKAYHQDFVKPQCWLMTAFVTPWGLYGWVRTPFGLMNAPWIFQRFMQSALEGMNNDFCIPYMDDVIIFSNSFEDHINQLRKVLQRLREKGVKLKARKCKLFKHEVNYLGRIASPEGYRIDPSNVKAVQELKNSVPKQVGDIRKLLGLLGCYRRYIPDFAQRAKPLFELLQCHDKDLNEHKGKEQKGKSQSQVSSEKPILWNQERQTALEDLIDCLTSPPILAYPQFDQPYVLHSDACIQGWHGCHLLPTTRR